MRAVEPTQTLALELYGFSIGLETFGDRSNPAVLFLPPWQIVHSRIWKMQVPFLARSHYVVTLDAPGNGMGERTCDTRAYEFQRIADQSAGVLDHLQLKEAAVVGFSRGCAHGLVMAATYPERVSKLILIAGKVSGSWDLDSPAGVWDVPRPDFWKRHDSYPGWKKFNAHYWREQYQEWLGFFFNEVFLEPHSTKAVDDCTAWANETDPEVLISAAPSVELLPELSAAEAIDRIRCPVMMIHGTNDRCSPVSRTHGLASERPDWTTIVIEGAGHAPMIRDPVKVNMLLRDFLASDVPERSVQETMNRGSDACHRTS